MHKATEPVHGSVVFREWGDDERENKVIGVQTRALPRCIYDVFMYKLSVELRKYK